MSTSDSPLPIGINRFGIKSRWLYGLGGADEVTLLERRLQNCIVLENDRIESRLAAQELECMGVGTQAAVAGNISQVGLVIPANSGLVVVLEKIYFSLPISAPWQIRRQYSAAGATAGTAIARDTRAGSSRVPACDIRSTVNPAQVGTLGLEIPSNINIWEGEIVMAASETSAVAIWVSAGVVNQQVNASFMWRERAFESGFLS